MKIALNRRVTPVVKKTLLLSTCYTVQIDDEALHRVYEACFLFFLTADFKIMNHYIKDGLDSENN